MSSGKQQWRKWIEPSLGRVPLATLAAHPDRIQDFKVGMIDAGAGEQTQKKVLTILSSVLGKAVELQRIESNPCRVIKKPHVRSERPKIPGRDAVRDLLAAFKSDTDRLLAALIAYAGLRPGEALALHKSDIGKKAISITKAIKLDGEGSTKTNGVRMVPISDELRPFLQELSDGALFIGERTGEQWTTESYRNWRDRKFQTSCVAVGLGVVTKTETVQRSYSGMKPYDPRHYAGSMWLHEGNDPIIVARWMGHSLAVFLNIYAHVIAELGDGIEDDSLEDDGCILAVETASKAQSAQ